MGIKKASTPAGQSASRRHRAAPEDKQLGQRLRDIRRSKGLTLQDLAVQIGVTYQQVQKYEAGTDRLSASALYQLSCYLGVPIDQFFQKSLADDIRDLSKARDIEDPSEGLAYAEQFVRIQSRDVRRLLRELTVKLSGVC
ncbi:MAG: helix-turn-helix domain-containing protein [Alphaproteobacteria bacterium]|nr:helix-turn-helix domain-containing protein [Alphaproteobacteria bacterium]